MKARVISDNCIGCGQCEAITDGKVFELQDDGIAHAIVDSIPEELEEDAEMAASSCPTDAIEIEKVDAETSK